MARVERKETTTTPEIDVVQVMGNVTEAVRVMRIEKTQAENDTVQKGGDGQRDTGVAQAGTGAMGSIEHATIDRALIATTGGKGDKPHYHNLTAYKEPLLVPHQIIHTETCMPVTGQPEVLLDTEGRLRKLLEPPKVNKNHLHSSTTIRVMLQL